MKRQAKTVKITPEIIIGEMMYRDYTDGYGNVTIICMDPSDSHWIDMALTTLDIVYNEKVVESEPDPYEPYFYEKFWTFRIEDIKDDCPHLYADWLHMDKTSYLMLAN